MNGKIKLDIIHFRIVFIKFNNNQTREYYAMNIIQKNRIKNINEDELIKIIKDFYKLKAENNICMKDFNYITYIKSLNIYMDLCDYNLENYIKMREDSILVNEVKAVLIQLNNTFKIMFEKQIIHGYLHQKKYFYH
jgi:hypothetical protein